MYKSHSFKCKTKQLIRRNFKNYNIVKMYKTLYTLTVLELGGRGKENKHET